VASCKVAATGRLVAGNLTNETDTCAKKRIALGMTRVAYELRTEQGARLLLQSDLLLSISGGNTTLRVDPADRSSEEVAERVSVEREDTTGLLLLTMAKRQSEQVELTLRVAVAVSRTWLRPLVVVRTKAEVGSVDTGEVIPAMVRESEDWAGRSLRRTELPSTAQRTEEPPAWQTADVGSLTWVGNWTLRVLVEGSESANVSEIDRVAKLEVRSGVAESLAVRTPGRVVTVRRAVRESTTLSAIAVLTEKREVVSAALGVASLVILILTVEPPGNCWPIVATRLRMEVDGRRLYTPEVSNSSEI
jgi:hypothetical protein